MVQVISMMAATRAALDHIIPTMIKALARPEGLGQVPVEDAARVRRESAVEEKRAGGLELYVQVVVELEAAARALQVQPIPVQAQSVRHHRRRSIRQIDGDPRGVEELEGRHEGPADATKRQVSSSNRAAYGRPRTGQAADDLARFLGPDREKLPCRGCFPHYGGPDQDRPDSLPPQRVRQQAQAEVLVSGLARAPPQGQVVVLGLGQLDVVHPNDLGAEEPEGLEASLVQVHHAGRLWGGLLEGPELAAAAAELEEVAAERPSGVPGAALAHPGVDAQVVCRRLDLARVGPERGLEGGAQRAGAADNDALLGRDSALPLVSDDVVERGPRLRQPGDHLRGQPVTSMDEQVVDEHCDPDQRVLVLEPAEGGEGEDLNQVGREAASGSDPAGGEVGGLGNAVERHHPLAGVLVQGDGEERLAEPLSAPVVPQSVPGDMLVVVAEVPHEARRGLWLVLVRARLRKHGLQEDDLKQRTATLMAEGRMLVGSLPLLGQGGPDPGPDSVEARHHAYAPKGLHLPLLLGDEGRHYALKACGHLPDLFDEVHEGDGHLELEVGEEGEVPGVQAVPGVGRVLGEGGDGPPELLHRDGRQGVDLRLRGPKARCPSPRASPNAAQPRGLGVQLVRRPARGVQVAPGRLPNRRDLGPPVGPSRVDAHGVLDPVAPLLLGGGRLQPLLLLHGGFNRLEEAIDGRELLSLAEGAGGGGDSGQDRARLDEDAHETGVRVVLRGRVVQLVLKLIERGLGHAGDRLVGLMEHALQPREGLDKAPPCLDLPLLPLLPLIVGGCRRQ